MLPNRDLRIEKSFTKIHGLGYKITSPENTFYNCIAWAAEDDTRWWWPDMGFQAYWPEGVSRVCTVESFVKAYNTIGYEQCVSGEHESGFIKVAIFTDSNGVPTHAARELPGETMWTSKLGPSFDISHHIYGLNDGGGYGNPTVFMKKVTQD